MTTSPLPSTVDPSADMILDTLLVEDRNEVLFHAEKTFPGLSKLLLATAMHTVNSRMEPYLEAFRNEAGTPAGRSLSGTEEPEEDETAIDTPDFYLRPNGQKYYHRAWGEHRDVEVLRKAREVSQYVFLYGPPGTGKTAMAEAAFGEDLITVIGTGDLELSDLIGGYVPMPDGTYPWVDGPLIIAAEQGRPLLIDEIGVIEPKVLTGVYGLMDGRGEYTVTANPSRGTVKAAPGFYVIAATNPNAPGVRISEALMSRFAIHTEVSTDYALARKLGVDSRIVTVATNLDRKMRDGGGGSWAPQFRELMMYRDVCKQFGEKFAIENLIASAPEMDRDAIGQLFSRNIGKTFLPALI